MPERYSNKIMKDNMNNPNIVDDLTRIIMGAYNHEQDNHEQDDDDEHEDNVLVKWTDEGNGSQSLRVNILSGKPISVECNVQPNGDGWQWFVNSDQTPTIVIAGGQADTRLQAKLHALMEVSK